jgi:hypothetical protein
MPDKFDPYLEWLGIPPAERPVHHYRLLGLATFESDSRAIQAAADRLMAHVRTFQTGRRASHSQRLLTEISAAKLCLLDADTRAMYDAVLRGQLAAANRTAPALRDERLAIPPPPPVYTAPQPMAVASSKAVEDRYAAPAELEEKRSFSLQPWVLLVFAAVCLGALGVFWGVGKVMQGKHAGREPVDPATPAQPTSNDQHQPTPPTKPEPPLIMQEAGGEVNLAASTAQIEGGARLETLGGQSVITNIASTDDRLRWRFRLEKPAAFRVEATYAATPASEGGTFTLSANGQTTKPITVRATDSDSAQSPDSAKNLVNERIGFLWIRKSGEHVLKLTPISLNAGQPLMTLASLRLVPVSAAGE